MLDIMSFGSDFGFGKGILYYFTPIIVLLLLVSYALSKKYQTFKTFFWVLFAIGFVPLLIFTFIYFVSNIA